MSNPTDPQQTPPPTSATVHSHLSLIQWLSLAMTLIGAATSYLQLLPPSVAWAQPALMFLGLAGVLVGATLKTLNSGNLCLIFLCGAGVLMLGGCSTNQTPRQVYRTEAALYNASALGFAAARAHGDIPPPVVQEVQPQFDAAVKNIKAAASWIQANPNLANVPGAMPPELTLMQQAVDAARSIARGYIAKYLLGIPELVPLDVPDPAATPPATQPATVPVPIPG